MEIISGRKTSTRKKNTPISPMVDLGKLQPQARDLEEAVLGALMLEKDAYSIISDILKPECFYEYKHQLIYTAIVDLAMKQEPIDMLTVCEQLRRNGKLEEVGGEYSEIQAKAYEETYDVDDLMQEAEGQLFEISQRNVKKDVTQINPVINEALHILEIASNRKDGLSGLQSGFTDLDKIPTSSSLPPVRPWEKRLSFSLWPKTWLSTTIHPLPSSLSKCRTCSL